MKDQIRETSDFVCRDIINMIDFHLFDKGSLKILEPSCGDGKILKFWLNTYNVANGHSFTCIELNKERLENAKENLADEDRHTFEFIQGDFLLEARKLNKKFNLILACPPFKNNVDLLHIRAMYDLLEMGGQLVTLTSPYWITNNEGHQVEFREWLAKIGADIQVLPDNSFMEKGKSVPTAIMSMRKY